MPARAKAGHSARMEAVAEGEVDVDEQRPPGDPERAGPSRLLPRRSAAPLATLAGPGCRAVYAVTFGLDGNALAAADGNGRVYVWNTASGALAATFAPPRSRGVIGAAFDPDGEFLAAAGGNGRAHNGWVYLRDMASRGLAGAFAGPGSRGVNGVAFGPAGDLLAAGDGNGSVYLWRMSSPAT
jgi:WD40 repeat protein